MGGTRALALAAIDVLEGTGRSLRRHHSQGEVAWGMSEEPDADERVRDRELRRHAVKRQMPADQSQRILDILDPPAWDPAPPDGAPVIKRCHELRTKPLKDFTDEDLRIMIEQQVALHRLVGLALTRLRADPLRESGRYPGDLLASVLGVNAWSRNVLRLQVFRDACALDDREQPLHAGNRSISCSQATSPVNLSFSRNATR